MATSTTMPSRTTDLRERKLSFSPDVLQTTDLGGGQAAPKIAPSIAPTPTVGQPTAAGQPGTVDITPENTLRSKRLGFEVGQHQAASPTGFERVSARDTTGSIRAAFDANVPAMMQKFKDESRALAQRTSALGRSGSGLFNRETGFVGDRALQAREALLGNLSFQATQADAGRALQAAMGNQSAGIQSNSIAAQLAQANANRALQVDMARQAHFASQQSREDQLARDAMSNAQIQSMLFGQGFQGAPTGAVGQYAQTALQGSQQYGQNAGMLGAQAGSAIQNAVAGLPSASPNVPQIAPQGPSPVVLPSFNIDTSNVGRPPPFNMADLPDIDPSIIRGMEA
jgi:hypothetical protein